MPESPTVADGVRGPLPSGRWEVDPAQSRVGFMVRAMWGLMPVKGHFNAYAGTLEVGAEGTTGRLEIDGASLDTRNRKRDEHLRSADFFAAAQHPRLTFTIDSVSGGGGQAQIDGALAIKDRPVRLSLPVAVTHDGDRLRLTTSTTVDRARAGLTWNRVGMITGPAHLDVDLVLEPAR